MCIQIIGCKHYNSGWAFWDSLDDALVRSPGNITGTEPLLVSVMKENLLILKGLNSWKKVEISLF
jgi:hypothetical protein